jgi:small subunit ribosomal protein S17
VEEASRKKENARSTAPADNARSTGVPVRRVRRTAPVQKVLQGRVVSNKMQKTIVVEIHQRKLHRLYKKYLTRTKKIKAHDEKNECGIGDTVRVVESRPLSKDKRWRLVAVVEKAK